MSKVSNQRIVCSVHPSVVPTREVAVCRYRWVARHRFRVVCAGETLQVCCTGQLFVSERGTVVKLLSHNSSQSVLNRILRHAAQMQLTHPGLSERIPGIAGRGNQVQ